MRGYLYLPVSTTNSLWKEKWEQVGEDHPLLSHTEDSVPLEGSLRSTTNFLILTSSSISLTTMNPRSLTDILPSGNLNVKFICFLNRELHKEYDLCWIRKTALDRLLTMDLLGRTRHSQLLFTSTLKRMHKDLRDVTDLQHIWSQDWNSSSICYFPQSNQIGSICYIYVWDFKIPKVYLDPPPPSPPIQVTPCPSPLGNIGLKHQTHIDTL